MLIHPRVVVRVLQLAAPVVGKGLLDLCHSIHHEGPMLLDGLPDGLASKQQEAQPVAAVAGRREVAARATAMKDELNPNEKAKNEIIAARAAKFTDFLKLNSYK